MKWISGRWSVAAIRSWIKVAQELYHGKDVLVKQAFLIKLKMMFEKWQNAKHMYKLYGGDFNDGSRSGGLPVWSIHAYIATA